MCHYRTDQGTEFAGGRTVEILQRLGAESQLVCPDNLQYNGVSERINRTLQDKVLYCNTVAWKTRKQSYVAILTCEVEYVAMCDARQELIELEHSISLILLYILLPVDLWCDNKATGASADKDGGKRLRHIPR
ncbi:uncharacterized protein LOC106646255 [Copidosoma floridanum]|uniref:uncharacterized protein LOC106646255 n=1 Tax=Copidosoma floridanum TaxID=29053 RepID=UPI0006C95AE4|nr:uncharacterized protein LOC106646255 [Copidosoma floridanum]